MCEQYNGWTNRETWALLLWVNNDQGLQESAMDYALTAYEEHKAEEESEDAGAITTDAVNCLADTLEEWVTEELLTFESIKESPALFNMLTDIGSLYRINWRETAVSFIEDAIEEVANA
jgi:hypothetical protein